MSLEDTFQAAVARMNGHTGPVDNQDKLRLYALYKQATVGDVQGKRPGALNMVARAKYDAWAERRGMSQDDARQAYIDLTGRF